MQDIIVKPGRFDHLARMLLDESVAWFGDSQVAAAVVDAIVSQVRNKRLPVRAAFKNSNLTVLGVSFPVERR